MNERSKNLLILGMVLSFTMVSLHSIIFNQRPRNASAVLAEDTKQILEREQSRTPVPSVNTAEIMTDEPRSPATVAEVNGFSPSGNSSESDPDRAQIELPQSTLSSIGPLQSSSPTLTDANDQPGGLDLREAETRTAAASDSDLTEDLLSVVQPAESLRPKERPGRFVQSSDPVAELVPLLETLSFTPAREVLSEVAADPQGSSEAEVEVEVEADPVARPTEKNRRSLFENGSRKIVGIFETGVKSWALVKDEANQIVVLQPGDRIGAGIVSEIVEGSLKLSVGNSSMVYSTGDAF